MEMVMIRLRFDEPVWLRPDLPPQQYLSSLANPKFAPRWSSAMSEFRIQSHTGNPWKSSVVLDLKFLNADATQIAGTSNPPH
jgi:hypothetical protein